MTETLTWRDCFPNAPTSPKIQRLKAEIARCRMIREGQRKTVLRLLLAIEAEHGATLDDLRKRYGPWGSSYARAMFCVAALDAGLSLNALADLLHRCRATINHLATVTAEKH